ncbi:MAG: hypothetical protein NVSMB25_01210 [Thermoleophilaceae bacterium]
MIDEQVISRPASIAIALIALLLLLRRRAEVPEPSLVAVAAVIGIVAFRWLHKL